MRREDLCTVAGCNVERFKGLSRHGNLDILPRAKGRGAPFTLWDAFKLRLMVALTAGTDGEPGVYPAAEMARFLPATLAHARDADLINVRDFAKARADVFLGGAEFEMPGPNGAPVVVVRYFAGPPSALADLIFDQQADIAMKGAPSRLVRILTMVNATKVAADLLEACAAHGIDAGADTGE